MVSDDDEASLKVRVVSDDDTASLKVGVVCDDDTASLKVGYVSDDDDALAEAPLEGLNTVAGANILSHT